MNEKRGEQESSRGNGVGLRRFVYAHWVGLGAVGVLAVSFACRVSDLPGFTVCWFKRTTGLPCPGCGMTRAFCCISHGEWARAWGFNPFSFAVYGMAVALVLIPIFRRVGLMGEAMEARLNRVMVIAVPVLAVFMLVFGVCRILAIIS